MSIKKQNYKLLHELLFGTKFNVKKENESVLLSFSKENNKLKVKNNKQKQITYDQFLLDGKSTANYLSEHGKRILEECFILENKKFTQENVKKVCKNKKLNFKQAYAYIENIKQNVEKYTANYNYECITAIKELFYRAKENQAKLQYIINKYHDN
ncbi:hypothetical protein EHP00_1725 [Ecytonucleospora hepatopenaei]|uniref:Uncharacterized protein n=1 Tax=Ecytonucleospora hepatopenaei TaxID=646526 RepID=A0A1W0E665_9MICR|nr:hypothetical protein EHP00_1725 [Ecytonucleospora hepatopenaei]